MNGLLLFLALMSNTEVCYPVKLDDLGHFPNQPITKAMCENLWALEKFHNDAWTKRFEELKSYAVWSDPEACYHAEKGENYSKAVRIWNLLLLAQDVTESIETRKAMLWQMRCYMGAEEYHLGNMPSIY